MLPTSTQNGIGTRYILPASDTCAPEPTGPTSDTPITPQDPPESDDDDSDSDLIVDDATLRLGGTVHSTRRRPPLFVSLTAYRLLNMMVVISFGTAKAVLTAQGKSAVPTVLDWVIGVVLTILLYWIGLGESVRPRVLPWFYHRDYSRDIIYAIGRFLWVLLVALVRGVFIPVSSISMTLIPMWYMFNLGAEGISTISFVCRIFGFLFTWFIINFVLAAIFNEMLIFPFLAVLLDLVQRFLCYIGAIPNRFSAGVSERASRVFQKAQKFLPSNIFDSDDVLLIIVDNLAALCIVILTVSLAHYLWVRYDDVGIVEYIGGVGLLMLTTMMVQGDRPERYTWNWVLVVAFGVHALYLAKERIDDEGRVN